MAPSLGPPALLRQRDGSRVTKGRLYPELEILLQDSSSNVSDSTPPDRLIEALREHVFNNMPVRLIVLPQMKLVGRNEFINNIIAEMTAVDEELLSEMEATIDDLGKMEDTDADDQEDDAREDPWKAVCEFLFDKFARYAILSHTWLPTGEIVYQDTLQKDWLDLDGPGMDKLQGFCEATYQDHDITLAWIDTLCINKESSAELDEAIQSMYKWYQKAAICITYLRDSNSLKDLKSDTWFQRGWTLQELIGPKIMQFYGRDWTRLATDMGDNDKANPQIQKKIYKVTGIEAKELVSFDPLTGSDIPTRMRWAAARKTTRGEDRAYSLMGIFGVNFSISYGEGAERAFFRLIEAIISSRHTSHVIQVLHWEGKAISDRIHTTRLIPSRPECYRESISKGDTSQDIQSAMIPTLLEPMVLTHLGLRVRLLLRSITVRIKIGSIYQRHAPFSIGISVLPDSKYVAMPRHSRQRQIPIPLSFFLDKRFPKVPTDDSLFQFYHPQVPTPYGQTFFLGIYTFKEDNDKNCIYLPISSCAFLLGIPTPKADPSIRDVSPEHFEPTSKIDTSEIIQLTADWFRGSPPEQDETEQGFFTIERELLESMGMKVVNVYL